MTDRFAAISGLLLFVLSSAASAEALELGDPDEPNGDDGKLTYLALGASDAVGVGAFPLTEGYVFEVAETLEDRGRDVELLNLGVPGANIDRIEDAARLFMASGQQADLITLWAGANDIIRGDDVGVFEAQLENILRRLREHTDAFIVIANIPDLTRLPRFINEPSEDVTTARVQAFSNAIESQARAFDVPVVDLFAGIDPTASLTSGLDGFHPNNEGHRRVADLFVDTITQELERQ